VLDREVMMADVPQFWSASSKAALSEAGSPAGRLVPMSDRAQVVATAGTCCKWNAQLC